MEWDQFLFKKALEFFRRARSDDGKADTTHVATLESLRPQLTLLARCLTGAPIEIFAAEVEGGCAGDTFFLPTICDGFEDWDQNAQFFRFRTVFMAIQRDLLHGWPRGSNFSLASSRSKALEHAPTVLATMFTEFPNLRTQFKRFETIFHDQAHWLYGKWLPLEIQQGETTLDGPTSDRKTMSDEEHTEREGPAREIVESVQADHQAIEDYTLMHQFEKVETIEEFNGNWRDLDGSDDLDAHSDALEEVDLRQTVRLHDPAHSTLKSEFLRDGYIPFSREQKRPGFHKLYDEWDFRKKNYRKQFCKVYPSTETRSCAGFSHSILTEHAREVRALKQKFSRFFNSWSQVRRQPSGSELDMDHVVDFLAEKKAGRPGDDRFYLDKRRERRDLSVLFLMDMSLSTDSYVENRKVLDTEKQAVTTFCEVLHDYDCRFRIDGFSSQTRNNCDYITLKSFSDTWPATRDRISSLKPGGYTRIGPALRHAAHLLKKEETRNKWIILLSDGKPNDFDRYEGRYGIEDVRQAIREANTAGVHSFALAIDQNAKFYLPRMFGHNAFKILNHPGELVDALSNFFFKLYRS